MIYFITTNKGKFEEINKLFKSYNIALKQLDLEIEEPRGELEKIAEYKAKKAFEKIKAPVFSDDSGLFIPSLKGFPGEYSKWVANKIGMEGILRLVEGRDRRAYFKTVICYYDGFPHLFKGITYGRIAEKPAGESKKGLPYDSIFIPRGETKTFAEDYGLKEKYNHRLKAAKKLIKFLISSSKV